MNISHVLKRIGLSTAEVDVFDECTRGFFKASEIAISVKLKRTNVYAILKSLVKKGLIVEIARGKVKKFRAVSPSRVYDYIEGKKLKHQNDTKKLDRLLDDLDNQFSISRRANVEFFNGREEVFKLLLEYPENPGREEVKKVTQFERYAMVGDVIDKANSNCEALYKKLKSRYIPEKCIVPDNDDSRKIIAHQTSKYPNYQKFRDFRLVDFEGIPLDSQTIITNSSVVLASATEVETWAVRFLDSSVFNSFNAMFSALWAQGKSLGSTGRKTGGKPLGKQ